MMPFNSTLTTTAQTMKTQFKFTVYINGQAIRKSFVGTSMSSIYNQFNNWVKKQGECETVDGYYVGMMAWRNHRGVIEIRDESVKAKIAQITKTHRAWLDSKLAIAA
jgi:hypothetical protein